MIYQIRTLYVLSSAKTKNELSQHPFIVLSEDEINKPELVFERLFDYAHFPDLRKSLEEIKYWVIHKNFPYVQNQKEFENTMYFFDKLQALLEAAYVINNGL